MVTVRIRTITSHDLPTIARVDVEVWSRWISNQFQREMTVPARSLPLLGTFLDGDPAGCFVAEEPGKIVGYIFSRTYGDVGYFGPFGVLPEYQRKGYGKDLVNASVGYLENSAKTIGLETMPQTGYNLGLYTKLGFKPFMLTFRMFKPLIKPPEKMPETVERVARPTRAILERIAQISGTLEDGLDYSKEVDLLNKHPMGEVLLLKHASDVIGFALCYAFDVPVGLYPSSDIKDLRVRLLGIDADYSKTEYFKRLLTACESLAGTLHRETVTLPLYSEYFDALEILLATGYRVHGDYASLVRLAKHRYPIRNPKAFNLCEWAG